MKYIRLTIIFILLNVFSITFAATGKELYISHCAICHGADAKATGPLAKKSVPPTPDLTTCEFQKKLLRCPGTIVSSIVLRPNIALISDTLKKNNIAVKPHTWTDAELRSINQYIISLIRKQPTCSSQTSPPSSS